MPLVGKVLITEDGNFMLTTEDDRVLICEDSVLVDEIGSAADGFRTCVGQPDEMRVLRG